jgi:hypothetical protein
VEPVRRAAEYIRFNFAAPVTIRSLTAWFADSNGHAGVSLPSDLTLTTTEGFVQTFTITDPDGDGQMVPFSFTGFETTTSAITFTAARSSQWTMLPEVTFYSTASPIPEPATSALAAGTLILFGAALRRKREK